MRHKWNYKRKGFLKIYVGVDVSTKQILALKITDDHSHDSMPYLGGNHHIMIE